jgi:hypothetical protein
MNLQPILNKNSPWTHMGSEFDVPDVAEKLMKYVVHSLKIKIKNKHFSFHMMPKQQTINFWFSSFLGINP